MEEVRLRKRPHPPLSKSSGDSIMDRPSKKRKYTFSSNADKAADVTEYMKKIFRHISDSAKKSIIDSTLSKMGLPNSSDLKTNGITDENDDHASTKQVDDSIPLVLVQQTRRRFSPWVPDISVYFSQDKQGKSNRFRSVIKKPKNPFDNIESVTKKLLKSSNSKSLNNGNKTALSNNNRSPAIICHKPKFGILKMSSSNLILKHSASAVLKSSKICRPQQITPIESTSSNKYTVDQAIRLAEKEAYRLLIEQISANQLFQPVAPPVTNGVNKSNGVSKGKSIAKTTDEVMRFDIKPPTRRSSPMKMYNFSLLSAEWIQELKIKLVKQNEETQKFITEKERQMREFEEKRVTRQARSKKRSKEALFDEIVPELTADMDVIVNEALRAHSANAVVSNSAEFTILYKDIDTLSGLNWLNDEIINAYMTLIRLRSKLPSYPSVYAFSSFFYPKFKAQGHATVKRWTRKEDIFSYDINLVPLHLGMHWALCVIDHRYKKIQYYDSMSSKESCLIVLKQYLIDECRDKKKMPFDTTGWELENMKNIPPQLNGSDCGMFALKYAEYITRNAKITFTQQHMQYFRRKMVYEIVTGALM